MRVRGVEPEIGTKQKVLEILERRCIELALGEEVADARRKADGRAPEPFSEATPPGARGFIVTRNSLAGYFAEYLCSSVSVTPSRMTSEELLGRILHRDALAIILDKPAGLPVHAGPRNASERNGDGSVPLTSLFDALRFGLPRRPELAHRLDRETSGCLVLGRNRAALERLGSLFPIRQGHEDLLGGRGGRPR